MRIYYATGNTTNSSTLSVSGNIGKSIVWGKLSIDLRSSLSLTNYQLLISKNVVDFNMRNLSAGINLSYHPIDILSLEHKSTYTTSHRKSKEGNLFITTQKYFYHNLKLYLLPGNWQLEISNDYFQSNEKSISSSFFFFDLSISYKQKTWEAMLQLNNVCGIHDVEQTYSTDNKLVYTKTVLRPRELVLKLSFSL